MERSIGIHDVRYMMTLKDMQKSIYFRIYDYLGLDCVEIINNKLISSEYNLDNTLLSYLNGPSIHIASIRMEYIDILIFSLLIEIESGMITPNSIGCNSKEIAKLPSYCNRHCKTRRKELSRYVIHYLDHKMPKRGG